ncbi:hypothetical protein OTU49_009006, partial [Cherax quadricarinatus]
MCRDLTRYLWGPGAGEQEETKTPQRMQWESQWEVERERSVFVYGLDEAKGETYDERKQEEKKAIEDIMKVIGEGNMTQVANFRRIGWFTKKRNRPLKVIFKAESTRTMILQEKARLRGKQEFRSVYLDRDRTQDERKTMKERVQKRKEKWEEMKKESRITQDQMEGQAHPPETPAEGLQPR